MTKDNKITSNKPYLVRAIYDWIADNGYKVYILVDASFENLQIPREYVNDGFIVLNISEVAVHKLDISNEDIYFEASFKGRQRKVIVSMESIAAIYAPDNPELGMQFAIIRENEETGQQMQTITLDLTDEQMQEFKKEENLQTEKAETKPTTNPFNIIK